MKLLTVASSEAKKDAIIYWVLAGLTQDVVINVLKQTKTHSSERHAVIVTGKSPSLTNAPYF
jgi:hypothetical protein